MGRIANDLSTRTRAAPPLAPGGGRGNRIAGGAIVKPRPAAGPPRRAVAGPSKAFDRPATAPLESMGSLLPGLAATSPRTGRPGFSRRFRHVPSCVTYFSKPADRLCPFRQRSGRREFTPMAAFCQRLARAQDRRGGVRLAHGDPRGDLVFPIFELLADLRAAHGRGREGAGRAEGGERGPSCNMKSCASGSARGPTNSRPSRRRSRTIEKKLVADISTLIGQANEAIGKVQAAGGDRPGDRGCQGQGPSRSPTPT